MWLFSQKRTIVDVWQILNVTLSEVKVSTRVTQGNLKLLLRLNSSDLHQMQIQEDEILDWSHVDKAKNLWLLVGQLSIKAVWWNAPLALRDISRSNKHEDSHKESHWFPVFPPWFPAFSHWFLAFPPWFPTFPLWFLAFPPWFPTFPPWFPAFPPWFHAFLSFRSFRSLNPHSGFRR